MKTRIMIFAIAVSTYFLSTLQAFAQNAEPYTLQQCIDYALKNSNDIKNADLDIQSAIAKVGEIRGMGLPQLSGNASITDNPELPRMYLQGTNANAFRPAGSPALDPNGVYAMPNIFQLRTTGDVNLGLNQLLFDGSYIMGLKASKVYKDLAIKSMTQTKVQVVENVTKAFYVVLINKEQLELINANVSRLDSLVSNTDALLKAGFVENIDAKRIQVAKNNLMVERTKFMQLNEVVGLLLKFQMGMPLDTNLVIKGDIKDIQVESIDMQGTVDPETRIEYSLLKTQMDLQLLDVRNNQAKFLPSLAGFAKGGYNRSDLSVANTLSNHWYSYMMLGVSLNIPIIEGGSRIYKVKQAKYQYQKSENNLNQFRHTVDLQVQQSRINLKNEMENLKIQKSNLDLATEVVRIAKVKYEVGAGSNLEIVDAENAFKEAQTNYYNTIYNLLVSKLEYQKSTGTLYKE